MDDSEKHTPGPSSDSDDELPSMSDVLWSPTKPAPLRSPIKTRAQATASSQTASEQMLSPLKSSPLRPVITRQPCAVAAKYSLDNLLKTHSKKKEMKAIDEDLREQIEHGGLLAMSEKAEDMDADVPDELGLMKTAVEDLITDSSALVPDFPPCEEIFMRGHKIAGVPNLSYPDDYEPNEFEKLVQALNNNGAVSDQLVSLDMFKLAYASRPCGREIFVWLFRTAVVHPDMCMADKAFEQVCLLIKKWGDKESVCLLHVDDVVWMMKAYGATCDVVAAEGADNMHRERIQADFPLATARKRSHSDVEMSSAVENRTSQAQASAETEVIGFHFSLMLQMLATSVETRPSFYSSDTHYLLYLLLRCSLDASWMTCYTSLTPCLAWLLEIFSDDQWKNEQLGVLCDALLDVTPHHHQMYSVAQALPPTARGRQLQKQYCFKCLFCIVLNEPVQGERPAVTLPSKPVTIQVSSLVGHIRKWKVGAKLQTDYYAFHSSILILDMCVGSDMLLPKYKGDIQVLMQLLNVLKHDIRDLNGQHMDRMKVKDLLMRLHVRYDIWLQASQTAEAKVDDYFNRGLRNSTEEALRVANPHPDAGVNDS
eukprot:scpid13333/ scgid22296/ 